MLKHKDRKDRGAMNLNDFVVPSNQIQAKSVKLNARNLQKMKTDTESLAKENDEMEETLKILKERMSMEKEERTQSGHCRWRSVQREQSKNATSVINSKRTMDSRLQKLSARKVKTLKEHPPTAQPPPPSTASVRPCKFSKGSNGTGQCEVRVAELTEPQTHASARDVVSRLPTQPNPGGNPATFSSPNPRSNPAHNHGALSDGFPDQRRGNAATARHMQMQDNSSQILIVHREETNHAENPFLLNGAYDEEESAKSFQEALKQWRKAGPGAAQDHMWTPQRTVSNVPTQADLSPGGGGAGRGVPVRVEFADRGLTLMDRLLLKKHRRTPIDYHLPMTDVYVKPLPPSPEKELELGLTAEDQEAHSYLASLFAVPANSQRSGLDNSARGVCLTIEVLDEGDKAEAKGLVNRVIPMQKTEPTQAISCSHRTQSSVLSRNKQTEQTKTSHAVYSALSKPESGTGGTRSASITTASSKSKKPAPRSHSSHGAKAKSHGSALLPLLSSSAPLYRKTHNAVLSYSPDNSPSTSPSSAFTESDSYSIPPVLRTTFTLSPSNSVKSALLPKLSENVPGMSSVPMSRSPRQFQHALSDDTVRSSHEPPVSQSPTSQQSNSNIMSNSKEAPRNSVGLSTITQDAFSRSKLPYDGTHEKTPVSLTLEHKMAEQASQSERHNLHFALDQSVSDSRDNARATSTGFAKESTFALIQEYRNALKSMQDNEVLGDSEDEMSTDSLELTRCEEDSTDEDAEGLLDSGRSRVDGGDPFSAHFDENFVPVHKERKRDLPPDEAWRLSEPARVPSLWSDSDDSSDDSPPINYRNLHLQNFDAVHQSRTSLDSCTYSSEVSQAAMLGLSGCEEAASVTPTMSRLERELRMLARETGPEVYTAASGNSREPHPRGNRLCARRTLSEEEHDEEEAILNDCKAVLLLP